ncbi:MULTISPECIES: DUF2510 domain-containing protein [Kitasatospora]|uniref:DUF2510 domain-containing protein n=1 Tax=Kitasatospora cathayae TaxID=3004092 RepID=A0ABY7Q8Y9_9ACTN|nr:DUF2510 domain-containing protein [Kitasatospora sp. HUAS 3-15]WBP89207.1 DUF2510 domain-containing protein [Kitasatospora sp. HUAS 3-15]
MSNSTPPGWYPVPGADGAPGHERWWDGNAWTSEVRPLQGGAAQVADAPTQTWQPTTAQPRPGYGYPAQSGSPAAGYGYPVQDAAQPPGYGHPGQAGYPGRSPYPGQEAYPGAAYGYPPPTGGGGTRPGVIIGIAVAVLAVGGLIAGLVFSNGGDPKAGPTPNPTVTVTQTDSPAPSPTPTRTTPTVPAPKPVPSPKSTVPDPQHAITVPVFDGWEAATNSAHSTVYLGSGRYTCADGNSCIRGQFSIEKDTVQGSTPKGAADAAMPGYAGTIFSGITSHTDSGSGYVSVAGVLGYATRWHVSTSDGTRGYVLLAAVPAKGGGYVVFEGGVDDDPAAPDASVLDQILKGIKQDSSSGSST